MAAATDHGEGLARLEGAYEHLATKADIADLKVGIEKMQVSIINWIVGVGFASATVAAAVASTVVILLTPWKGAARSRKKKPLDKRPPAPRGRRPQRVVLIDDSPRSWKSWQKRRKQESRISPYWWHYALPSIYSPHFAV